MIIPDLQAQWEGASQSLLEFSILGLVSDDNDIAGLKVDQEKADRIREDWSPFIAGLVKIHASNGTLEANLG